jgi:hypothetical protein
VAVGSGAGGILAGAVQEVLRRGPPAFSRESPHIWAPRPPAACPRVPRRARRPRPRPACATGGSRRRTDERRPDHRSIACVRKLGARGAPKCARHGEGARGLGRRAARMPRAAGARMPRGQRGASGCGDVPCFERYFLTKFE